MIRLSKLLRNNRNKFITNKFHTYQDFKTITRTYSDDYNMHLSILEHQKTGAFVYHIQNSDNNNAFAVIAQTLPNSDKGCAHILEHISCCGSHKFPVRDPFFKMLRRSVNTYMNAWTGQDFTCYPFSSANIEDWKNLYKVYLDMSLKPLLDELDFRQEGWRYQFDENGQKIFKGIVLNEMKGAYQNSQRQISTVLNTNLFSCTPYSYDSGGKPSQIVKLQYDQLRDMHRKYYHPSNLSFYFYGDSDISDKLKYLNSEYLSGYERENIRNLQNNKPILKRKYERISSKTAENNSISLGYYLGTLEQISQVDKICLRILSYILLQTNQAQLYKQFIESSIADNFGMSGFSVSKLVNFSINLKGVKQDYDQKMLVESFKNVLKRLSQQGVPIQRVDEYIHQYQLDILLPKKNNGLRILQHGLVIFNHRGDVSFLTNPRQYIKQARQKIINDLNSIIDKYFLNNDHFAVVLQKPQEKKDTQQVQKLVGVNIQQHIIRSQQQLLKLRQNRQEKQDILPILKMEDIKQRQGKKLQILKQNESNGCKTTHYFIPIDENVNYYRIVFKIDRISQQLLDMVDLWAYSINNGISAGKYNEKQFSSLLASTCSQFKISTAITRDDSMAIILSAACLPQNKNKIFNIFNLLINEGKFEKNNMQRIFRSYNNDVMETLKDSPMNQCLDQCSSSLSKKGYIFNKFRHMLGGFEIAKKKQTSKLQKVFQIIRSSKEIKFIEHSRIPSENIPHLANSLSLNTVPDLNFQHPNFISEVINDEYGVSYCTQQYQGPSNLTPDHAHLSLLLEILQHSFLHPLIRQKGGAYGARSLIRQNGIAALYSYMDPNPEASFKIFSESVEKLINKTSIDEKQLVEAKISRFGTIDKPVTPQSQNVDLIVKGYSLEMIKCYRKEIKNAESKDLLKSGIKYLQQPFSRVLFSKIIPKGFESRKLQFK